MTKLDLESRILNTAYHAGRNGRFAKAWSRLWSRAVDDLQALIDEDLETACERRNAIRLDEMRGK